MPICFTLLVDRQLLIGRHRPNCKRFRLDPRIQRRLLWMISCLPRAASTITAGFLPPETPIFPSVEFNEFEQSFTAPRSSSVARSASTNKPSRLLTTTHVESNVSSRPARSSSVTGSAVSYSQNNNFSSMRSASFLLVRRHQDHPLLLNHAKKEDSVGHPRLDLFVNTSELSLQNRLQRSVCICSKRSWRKGIAEQHTASLSPEHPYFRAHGRSMLGGERKSLRGYGDDAATSRVVRCNLVGLNAAVV